MLKNTPLENVNYSFSEYLTKKKLFLAKHMDGDGIPDYAYGLDYEMRKKLDSIPGLYKAAKIWTGTLASKMLQKQNRSSLAVGPNQMPEIYEIACDCARRLGMAVPNVYISSENVLNAYTYASDDVEPFIVITSEMVEKMSLGEIKAVIGHECGHIQNQHTIYNAIAALLVSIGTATVSTSVDEVLASVLSKGANMALKTWSRAAEVTADRAGMICADTLYDAYSVDRKLMYGGAKVDGKIDTDIDFEALREQMEMAAHSPYAWEELLASHPMSVKRIFADMEFAECEVLYEWRPDLKTPGQIMRTKKETDKRCKNYISITAYKGGAR